LKLLERRVLISGPSLDPTVNVSGISTIVNELSAALHGKLEYKHVRLGAPQTGGWLVRRAVSLGCIGRAIITLSFSPAFLFHSNTAFDFKSMARDFVLIFFAKAAGKRVLLHVHGGRYVHEGATGLIRKLQSGLIKLSDRVIFLSNTERKAFQARCPAYAEKMFVIYNALNLEDTDCVRPGNHEDDQLFVTFVGRLVHTKGVDVMLEAARASYPCSVRFFIHGDGPLRSLVEKAAEQNPFLTHSRLFSHSHWPDVLSRYDVLLLPSVAAEGMPMVILEGMALGLVPITTPIASIPEIVEDGTRGILVPFNDVPAVVRAISSLASDRSKLKLMSDACRAYARANFDIRVGASRVFEIYCDLVPELAS
jgi:glycosyltransferase involved in cell wall biosynthesis